MKKKTELSHIGKGTFMQILYYILQASATYLTLTTYVLQANASCLTLATQKEIIELDISQILSPPEWLENETEMDIEMVNQ